MKSYTQQKFGIDVSVCIKKYIFSFFILYEELEWNNRKFWKTFWWISRNLVNQCIIARRKCVFCKMHFSASCVVFILLSFKKQTKCIGLVFNHRFPILQACVYHKNTLFLIYARLKLCMYDKSFLRNTTSSLEVW